MRVALGWLQQCADLGRTASVDEVAGRVPMAVLLPAWRLVFERPQWSKLSQSLSALVEQAWPTSQILDQLLDLVLTQTTATERWKARSCVLLALAERHLADGGDPFLQLLALFDQLRPGLGDTDCKHGCRPVDLAVLLDQLGAAEERLCVCPPTRVQRMALFAVFRCLPNRPKT